MAAGNSVCVPADLEAGGAVEGEEAEAAWPPPQMRPLAPAESRCSWDRAFRSWKEHRDLLRLRVKILDKMCAGFSSEIGTKLRDWAIGQAWGSCYSWAALSSNDSKTLYAD